MVVYMDKMSAINSAKNLASLGRTKHIEIHLHWISEIVAKARGELQLHQCATNVMAVDFLTKVLPKGMFFACFHRIGMYFERFYLSPVIGELLMGMPYEGQALVKRNKVIASFVSHTFTHAMMRPLKAMRELGFPHLALALQFPNTSAIRQAPTRDFS